MLKVTKILALLEIEALVTDVKRIGRAEAPRSSPRSILFTVQTPWDKRQILLSAPKFKLYGKQVFISPDLSVAEATLESQAILKRKELPESGVPANKLKLRSLKLYMQISEKWEEVPLYLSHSSLKLIVYNVRSLLNLDRRLSFSNAIIIDQLEIIVLTETWLYEQIEDCELFLSSYRVHRAEKTCTNGISKHGGVLIAVKEGMKHARVQLSELDCMHPDVAAVQLTTPKKVFIICAVYNAPKESPFRWPSDKWEQIIQILDRSTNSEVILTGDFNLPNTDWETMTCYNLYEQSIVAILDRNSFCQVVDFTTRSDKLLDLILTRNTDNIQNARIDE